MEFEQVVRRRRMVRAFTSDPVPDRALARLVHNVTHGPSAGNSQGHAFLLLDTTADRDRFWAVLADMMPVVDSVRTAPLLLVALTSKDAYLDRYAKPDKGWTDRDEGRWPVPYWHVDAGMAVLLALLTAVDEELGAVFFGIPTPRLDAFRAEFGVPAEYVPVGTLAIGYPDRDAPRSRPSQPRRPTTEFVHHGRWGA